MPPNETSPPREIGEALELGIEQDVRPTAAKDNAKDYGNDKSAPRDVPNPSQAINGDPNAEFRGCPYAENPELGKLQTSGPV